MLKKKDIVRSALGPYQRNRHRGMQIGRAEVHLAFRRAVLNRLDERNPDAVHVAPIGERDGRDAVEGRHFSPQRQAGLLIDGVGHGEAARGMKPDDALADELRRSGRPRAPVLHSASTPGVPSSVTSAIRWMVSMARILSAPPIASAQRATIALGPSARKEVAMASAATSRV